MSHRAAFDAMIVVAIAATPAAAQPGGVITSGILPSQATYGFNGSPTSQTDGSYPRNFVLAPGTGVNQLIYNWWFYRVAGDSVQRPFGNYVKSDGFGITGTSNWPMGGNGNTASYQWTENGPPGGVRFNAAYTMTLSNGPTAYDAQLEQSFQISNPNSAPLSISLFDSAVVTPDNHTSGLSASGGINAISITDGVYNDTLSAVGASAFEVATDATLGNLLFGGPAGDLNDTGLPVSNSAGTITDAYEWTLTIPADSSETVSSAITSAHAVPEPSTLLLIGTAATLGFGRRRLMSPRANR